ncbi:MAG: acyl--CoA ligase [Ruminococcus sp.]|nr:acyl--CoA ligase [Ruminococcus sp.]
MDKIKLLEYKEQLNKLSEKEKKLRDFHLKRLATGEIQGPPTGYASIDKPWLKFHPDKAINHDVPKKTIYRNLVDNSKDHLNDIALIYFDRKITYSELLDMIDKTAKALSAKGLKSGDFITLLSVTTPESIALLYAANKIGVSVNLMDPTTNKSRIEFMCQDTNSKAIFVLDLFKEKIADALKNYNCEIFTLSAFDSMPLGIKIGAYAKIFINKLKELAKKNQNAKKSSIKLKNWKEFLKDSNNEIEIEVPFNEEHIACCDYTGGSTGVPKGALLTDYNVNALATQYQNLDMNICRGQTMLNIMPMFLAYGVNMLNMSLNVGVTNIIIPKFDASKFADLLIKYRFNHFMGVPAHFESLIDNPKLDGFDLSFWITPAAGGDLANNELEKRINNFLKNHNAITNLLKGYGLTEMSSAVATCTNKVNAEGSAGFPLVKNNFGIFEINIENGTTSEDEVYGYNKIGEICITGPSMMKEYYNNPTETAKAIKQHSDGTYWLHTGDIGYINKDGLLFIKGRLKRVIIRPDGHNVFPSEIENVISKHHAVKEVVVIGVKDEESLNGKWCKAIIVLHDAYKDKEDVIKEELKALCLESLQERDGAKFYGFIDSMPYNHAGKPDIVLLEQEEEKKHLKRELIKK